MVETADIGSGVIERKEIATLPPPVVEANSYRTRGEPLKVAINGNFSEWHSVKGGARVEGADTANTKFADYETLFNIDTDQWLKIVSPKATSEKLEPRLKQSVEIAKTAFAVAGLPELADDINEVKVNIHGKDVYGFITPHLGQSIQHFIRTASDRGENKDEVKSFVSTVYEIAFQQALTLYRDYGYWMEDPNPGNILIHEKEGQYYVLLIDFATKQQIMRVDPSRIPIDKIPPEHRATIVEQKRNAHIRNLRSKFVKQCEKAGGELADYSDSDTPSPSTISQ